MAVGRGVEPHPISENRVFKARRRTNPAALPTSKSYKITLEISGVWRRQKFVMVLVAEGRLELPI